MSFRRSEQGFGLIGTVVLATALLIIATSLATAVLANFRYQHRAYLGTKALHLAEAGIERAIWELNQPSSTYTGETGTAFGGGIYDISITDVDGETKLMTAVARVDSGVLPVERTIRVTLKGTPSDQAAFNYGIQVGDGGLEMNNNSRVEGSVYSNGNAEGNNNAQIIGDLWVAGATGTISGFKGPGGDYGIKKSSAGSTDGDAHAHYISGSDIHGDAYYGCATCISSTTVAGTKYPDSPDPDPIAMPISDSQITDWKSEAAAGGSQGSFSADSGTWSLGPKKIEGELTLSGTAILNLTGALWVTGKITLSNSAIVQVDPSFGSNGTILISDSQITIQNSTILRGTGTSGSYLLTLSTMTGEDALVLQNEAQVDILYTSNGETAIKNNTKLKQVTAYKLEINNNATVRYESGLASAAFSSGPGGKWTVTAWQELR